MHNIDRLSRYVNVIRDEEEREMPTLFWVAIFKPILGVIFWPFFLLHERKARYKSLRSVGGWRTLHYYAFFIFTWAHILAIPAAIILIFLPDPMPIYGFVMIMIYVTECIMIVVKRMRLFR